MSSYVKKNLRAHTMLILSVDSIVLTHIEEEESAKTAWETLQKTYTDTGLTRKVSLLRELTTTKLEQCASEEEYINKIVGAAH